MEVLRQLFEENMSDRYAKEDLREYVQEYSASDSQLRQLEEVLKQSQFEGFAAGIFTAFTLLIEAARYQ